MILVTGGTGLLGAHLLFDLVSSGKKVRAIKRETSNILITKNIFSYYSENHEKLFSDIEWVNADMLDINSIDEAFEGIDYVYHCAAIVSFDPTEKIKVIKNNIDGTANLVNVCLSKKIKKLCHVSSVSALGDDLDGDPNTPVDEESKREQTIKHTGYSISKFNSEMEVWRGANEGLNTVIVNPSVIMGPGNWNNGSSMLFTKAWKGMKFYTSGVTGFVDVRDVTEIMTRLMESDISGERYCVNAENVQFRDFFNSLADNLGEKRPSFFVGPFLSELVWRLEVLRCFITRSKPLITREAAAAAITRVYYTSAKIEKELDFKFRPVKESVEDFSKFFLNDHK